MDNATCKKQEIITNCLILISASHNFVGCNHAKWDFIEILNN